MFLLSFEEWWMLLWHLKQILEVCWSQLKNVNLWRNCISSFNCQFIRNNLGIMSHLPRSCDLLFFVMGWFLLTFLFRNSCHIEVKMMMMREGGREGTSSTKLKVKSVFINDNNMATLTYCPKRGVFFLKASPFWKETQVLHYYCKGYI